MARSELRMISGSIARKTEMSKYYLVIKSLGNFLAQLEYGTKRGSDNVSD